MKYILFVLLTFLHIFLFAQEADSISVAKEVDTLIQACRTLTGQQKFEEALQVIEAAKSKAEAGLGKMSAGYASCLHNQGRVYLFMGKYTDAKPFCIEAKEIRKKVLSREHPDYAASLNNLAIIYDFEGDYDKTEALFLEAKEIRAKVFGEEHPEYALSLYNLANLYFKKGDWVKAEPLYLEAIKIQTKALGKEHIAYANSLTGLAVLCIYKGDYPKADSLYLEVEEIIEKGLGKEHPEYARLLNNRAVLYMHKGDYTKSETLFLEAIKIQAKTLGKEHPDYATFLEGLGELHYNNGNYEKAKPLFLEAEGIKAKVLGKEHLDYALSLLHLAMLNKKTANIPEASLLFDELNLLIRSLIEKSATYSSESQMLAYLHIIDAYLAQIQLFSLALPTPEFSRTSFDNEIFYNGFLLENARHLSRSVEGADSLTRATFERWQGCRRRLANEYAKPIAVRRYVAETEVEAEGYEKTLTRNLPAFNETRHAPRWQDVCESLKVGEAAVEFIHHPSYAIGASMNALPDDNMYAALILLPKDTAPHFIPLFEESQLQTLFNRPGSDEEDIIKHLYGNQPQFRDLFWKPLEPLLHNVKTIYYAPAGLLHRINPAALQDESKHTLSEGRQWVRVGSTRELVTHNLADKSFAKSSTNTDSSIDNSPSALIYGGITYDKDSLAYCVANATEHLDSIAEYQPKDGNFRYIIEAQPLVKFRSANDDRDTTWNSLINTEPEADVLGSLLTKAGFQTKVQKGFFASEERFKQIGVDAPSPRILHIATHGFSYPRLKKGLTKHLAGIEQSYTLLDDPMLRSGLVLAGANYYCINKRPLTNAEDGMLVAYEVRDLNLQNTELAVLSACQTGLGDVVGSEGVYGLQRAFRIAGAKFLIVSLWEVPDEQTQQVMRLFYQNWLEKKESLRDAFNHAQQTLKETEPSPFMWAGFVLIE